MQMKNKSNCSELAARQKTGKTVRAGKTGRGVRGGEAKRGEARRGRGGS